MAQGFPPQDAEQNWFLIGGSEDDGWTTLEFWRYLDTGDAASDRVITEVWSFGLDGFSYLHSYAAQSIKLTLCGLYKSYQTYCLYIVSYIQISHIYMKDLYVGTFQLTYEATECK